MARYRCTPEDFVVDELPAETPSGQGEQLWALVEKRGDSSEYVARGLALELGVDFREVGYAGRKDRWAVTRQWFSLPGVDPVHAIGAARDGWRVLRAERHPRRLRTGQLLGNRFCLRLRELDQTELEGAQLRLADLAARGMPNRYGLQRFGREGTNADVGRRLLGGERALVGHREARFALSALQSEVFNQVLASRPWPIDELVAGDVAVEHASGDAFVVEEPAGHSVGLARFELSPSGPIFGRRCLRAAAEPARLEAEAMATAGVDPDHRSWRLPRGLDLPGSRRPLRIPLAGAVLEAEGADAARLEVILPAGAYVTVLLEELFGESLAEGAPQAVGMGE